MSADADEPTITLRLTKPQALAAGAVLRGYVQHQRERLGDQAATNPNFQNVSAALRAIEAQTGAIDAEPGGARRA